MHNFILMLSLSRLKNAVDKNFLEIKNQNIINFYLKPNISENLKNNIEELNIKNNNSQIFIDEQNDRESISSIEESNFLFNSFIHVADSFKFDSEDWYLIYDDADKIKNK